MDKKVIFAVAGSGKTSDIINSVGIESRSLIVTYTESNLKNLRQRIILKFGYFPDNIKLYSYFTFLYSFCYKPFLSRKIKAKGIYWGAPPVWTMRKKRCEIVYYLSEDKRLYHNRIAKLLEIENIQGEIKSRIEKYFDCLFFDEIQDFGGHDFNFLKYISCSNTNIKFVGDFYQHTFDTSRDGNVNANIHKNYDTYKILFEKMGLIVDTKSLDKSYRCSPTICKFISDNIGIKIQFHQEAITEISFITDSEKANKLLLDNDIVKLFYKENYKYNCYSNNWGASKGEDHYNDVCIVLNPTTLVKYRKGELLKLPPQTKNKLYVACTRARGNLYFVPEQSYKKMSACI